MKQFTMHVATVGTSGPYALKEAGMGASFERKLDSLAVGESCLDCDGDPAAAIRLTMALADEPPSVDQARKERRERIATTALAGLLANPERTGHITDFARDARSFADSLIAELDASE